MADMETSEWCLSLRRIRGLFLTEKPPFEKAQRIGHPLRVQNPQVTGSIATHPRSADFGEIKPATAGHPPLNAGVGALWVHFTYGGSTNRRLNSQTSTCSKPGICDLAARRDRELHWFGSLFYQAHPG